MNRKCSLHCLKKIILNKFNKHKIFMNILTQCQILTFTYKANGLFSIGKHAFFYCSKQWFLYCNIKCR